MLTNRRLPLVIALLLATACGDTSWIDDAVELATRRQRTEGFDPLPAGFRYTARPRFQPELPINSVEAEIFVRPYNNPLPGYYPSYDYVLDVDGCPSSNINGYFYYWYIDGVYQSGGAYDCRRSLSFRSTGKYTVSLRITAVGQGERVYDQVVEVKDRLVVSLGDSYGAGEGAPDGESSDSSAVVWANTRCHRSANAPSALVARQLEEADPQSSVTYINLACSGATISRDTFSNPDDSDGFDTVPGELNGAGILKQYRGVEYAYNFLPSQLSEVQRLVGDRKIDILVLSAGGNDVGFADVLTFCTSHVNCHEGNDGTTLRRELSPLQFHLRNRYNELGDAVRALVPRHVYLMEYPNFIHDSQGNLCGKILQDTNWFGLDISWGELNYLEPTVYWPLLETMKATAADHGWHYVGGIAERFISDENGQGHGMCSSARWVNSNDDAKRKQGVLDEDEGFFSAVSRGAAHPNREGYAVMAEHLLASIHATPARVLDNVDVNGDGRHDLVRLLSVQGRLGLSVSLSSGSSYLQPWTTFDAGAGHGAVEWLTGDADGDGRTDLLQLWNDNGKLGVIVHRSDGARYALWGDTTGVDAVADALKYLSVDVNGDGRTDIVQLRSDGGSLHMSVHQATGTGYVTVFRKRMSAGASAVEWLTGDVDADGRTDLFQLWNNGNSLAVIVWHANGQGYDDWNWMDTHGVGGGITALKYLAADVDGDHRTDLVQLWNDAGRLGVIVHKNQGSSLVTTWGRKMNAGMDAVEWLTGDVDADGKTDIYQLWNNGGRLAVIVWHANGVGYDEWGWGDTSGIDAGVSALKYTPADVNGDGRTDLVQVWNNHGYANAIVHQVQDLHLRTLGNSGLDPL